MLFDEEVKDISLTTTMDNILNNWRNEVSAGFQGYLDNADLTHMEGHVSPDDELAVDYIETELEGEWLNETESWSFADNDEQIYLEMEAFCKDYYENELGDVWTGGGIVPVVSLWKYLYATDYLRENYEEIIKEALPRQ